MLPDEDGGGGRGVIMNTGYNRDSSDDEDSVSDSSSEASEQDSDDSFGYD